MVATQSSQSPLDALVQKAVAAIDAQPRRAPDRRSAPRVPCGFPVAVTLDGEPLAGIARDMSAGGMALELRRDIDLGHPLELAFELPGSPGTVECTGLVRAFGGVGEARRAGVEFHNLGPDGRRAVADWVRGRLEAPDDWQPDHPGRIDLGMAARVEPEGLVLRWCVPFASLWEQAVGLLSAETTFYVPAASDGMREGDRVFVEIVPPESHAMLRIQAEVTWVAEEGLGLRHAGLTPTDRAVLDAVSAHFAAESAKYR